MSLLMLPARGWETRFIEPHAGSAGDAMGVARVPVSRVPRGMLTAMGLASPTVREFGEVRHQYERPWLLDDSAARETFGLEPVPWARIVEELADTYRPAAATAA